MFQQWSRKASPDITQPSFHRLISPTPPSKVLLIETLECRCFFHAVSFHQNASNGIHHLISTVWWLQKLTARRFSSSPLFTATPTANIAASPSELCAHQRMTENETTQQKQVVEAHSGLLKEWPNKHNFKNNSSDFGLSVRQSIID